MNNDQKKEVHMHIQDLPKKYFRNNKQAKEYKTELIRMMKSLTFTNQKLQYSAQICEFNIASITKKKRGGFIPSYGETFRQVEEFTYHYENFCFRAYCFREKLLQFINAVLKIGYEENDVKIRNLLINPTIKETGLNKLIQKFDKDNDLRKVTQDRNSLTHKLYYGKEFNHYFQPTDRPKNADTSSFKRWCNKWNGEITGRAETCNKFMNTMFKMNHIVAPKIAKYWDNKKK